jgi:peptidoglycan lytic transglycosylase G
VLLVISLMLLPFVLGIGWFAYQLRPGSDGPPVTVTVTKSMGTGDVASLLADKGVIGSALAFQVWSTVSGKSPLPGKYHLHEGIGIRSAASILAAGPPVVKVPDLKLFLPPGLTLTKIADVVGKLYEKDPAKASARAAAFLKVAQSNTIRSKYEPAGVNSLEGLLFPDTYFIGAKWTNEQIIKLLVNQFDAIADKIGLANAQGLSPYQVVVAASLIQTEAKVAVDAPLISAVIRNRLAKGMPLQIDSTLCYAKGGCPPLPTDADKQINSPYNTYLIAALPPTPIASMTQANLQAALAPASVPYLYYVIADASGKHAFATTLAEHNQNVAAARAKGLLGGHEASRARRGSPASSATRWRTRDRRPCTTRPMPRAASTGCTPPSRSRRVVPPARCRLHAP